MNSSPINLQFGASQMQTSERMNKNPFLSRLVYSVFGYTNVGNWARSLVVIKLFAVHHFDNLSGFYVFVSSGYSIGGIFYNTYLRNIAA